ncbi:MAG: hypothetical protein IPP93_07345 [Chitinophagaceae bacterium]|nr:hypothetical protein [Chitinophagaceae bacterium]
MNKKIIISIFTAGMFFFAGQVNAQLSSSKPAMTDTQVKELLQQRSATTSKQTPATVTTASSQASVSASSNPASRTAPVKATDNNVSETPAKVTLPALPAVSNQGGVQPASNEPVKATEPIKATEVKQVPVSAQNTKTE